jgi:hypothetical protein
MGYVLFMSTHRACVCERVCASKPAVKLSLIFGRILSKSGKKHTTGHHTLLHICNVYAPRTRMCTLGQILSKCGRNIQHIPRGYMGYFNVCVNACANSAHLYTFAHRSNIISKHCQARDGHGIVLRNTQTSKS